LLADGMISPGDEKMFTVTDDPATVVRHILDCRKRLGITAVEA
jgi:predicted Rossmann-fold nucleotide-binding protein